MVTEFWARLEDAKGRIQGDDPAWAPSRQFLWDVVHDTRGLLRASGSQDDADLIRRIDAPPGKRPEFLLDPAAVRAAYARIRDAGHAPEAPTFRLVSPEGEDAWAAVHFFETGGVEYGLVGGWTGPILRILSPEPDQRFLGPEPRFVVGDRAFQIRAVPFSEYFQEDFDGLFRLLDSALARSLRVRFLQR